MSLPFAEERRRFSYNHFPCLASLLNNIKYTVPTPISNSNLLLSSNITMTITFESHTSEPKRPTSFPQISLLFTSPISYFTSVSRYLLIQILKQGPVPQHVGFVMDGNRRFAKKINVKTGEGHYLGFKKLEEVIMH